MTNLILNFSKRLIFSIFSLFLILFSNLLLFFILNNFFKKNLQKKTFISNNVEIKKFDYLYKYLYAKNFIKKKSFQSSLLEKITVYELENPILQINDFFLFENGILIKKNYFNENLSIKKIKIKNLENLFSFDKNYINDIKKFFSINKFIDCKNTEISYKDGVIFIFFKNEKEQFLIKIFPEQILTKELFEIIKKIQNKKEEFLVLKKFYKKKYKKILEKDQIDFFDCTLLDKKKIIYKKFIEKDLHEIL